MAEQAEQKTVDQGGQPPLPPNGMILLPVRQTVLFPGIVLPLSIGRKSSIAAAGSLEDIWHPASAATQNNMGVVNRSRPPIIVALQESTLTPVGMAISNAESRAELAASRACRRRRR